MNTPFRHTGSTRAPDPRHDRTSSSHPVDRKFAIYCVIALLVLVLAGAASLFG